MAKQASGIWILLPFSVYLDMFLDGRDNVYLAELLKFVDDNLLQEFDIELVAFGVKLTGWLLVCK